MHNTSHEFGFVDITNRRSLKVISEISPPRPASSSASSWKIAVEFYGGWRISSYFVKITICEIHSPKTTELILVVVISAGMAGNSQNGVSRENAFTIFDILCVTMVNIFETMYSWIVSSNCWPIESAVWRP